MSRLVVLGLLLSSSLVHADLAPPPPEELDCPRGAKGAGNGVSVWCEPTTCANDLSCGEGYRCSEEDIGLCVEPIEVPTERVRPTLGGEMPEVPMMSVRSVRRRGCEPNGTCLNVDSTCEHARRCVKVEVEPDVPSAPTSVTTTTPAIEAETETPEAPQDDPGGCSCRATDVHTTALPLLLVLLFRRRG